jgi:hypothetical protein
MSALLNHDVTSSVATNDLQMDEGSMSNKTEQENQWITNDKLKRGTLFRWGKRGTLFRWGKRGTLFRWGKRSNINDTSVQELCKKVLSKIQQNYPNVEIDGAFLANASNAYDANVLRVCLRLRRQNTFQKLSFETLNYDNSVFM